jgi:hypothetical protein
LPEELLDSRSQAFAPRGRGLAFPDDEDAIAEATESALDAAIARGVAIDLGDPVSAIGGGNAAAAARVTVPKAAGDEDGELAAADSMGF